MKSDVFNIYTKGSVTYMRFKMLEGIDYINHAVSTRHGGVSRKEGLKTLNLGFKTADAKENVIENYRRFCSAADFDVTKLVFAKQTHSDNVRIADYGDCGKGIFKKRDYTDVDAHITNLKNLPLVIHTADCVPVAFVDTVNRVIGNAHCGWRGTYNKLALKTLEKMKSTFGTNPKDVVAAIGPCICSSCYEVSKNLYYDFKYKFDNGEGIICDGEKYFLDLAYINRRMLTDAGVPESNIAVSDLCTCCNKKDLFSHRGLGLSRGLLSSVISLKE